MRLGAQPHHLKPRAPTPLPFPPASRLPLADDQSVGTFSPDGRIFQVEYAYKAIEGKGTAVGVKCSDGVILGVEKLVPSKMLVESTGRRVHAVEEHIGAATAGFEPDARMLISRARDEGRGYRQNLGEPIPPRALAERMGAFMHLFTLYSSYRPVGASILLAGYDVASNAAELYMAEPNGLTHVRVAGGVALSPPSAYPSQPPAAPRALTPPPPPPPLSALPRRSNRQGRARGKDGNRKAKIR